jgi:RHS repeat-associated protein
VRGVLDSSGAFLDALSYDANGNIDTGSELDNTQRGHYAWTGREFDVETQLQYNRARYYDPKAGRWTTQDPLGYDAGGSNLYCYVHNEPTKASDPSGLQGIAPGNFVDGTVSVTRWERLFEKKDVMITASRGPGMSFFSSLELGDLSANNIIIDRIMTATLDAVGHDTFYPVVRNGVAVKFTATFDAKADMRRYFWSQLQKTESKSENPDITKSFPSNPWQWDKSLIYPAGSPIPNVLEITDQPSINIGPKRKDKDGKLEKATITPVRVNNQLIFQKDKQWPADDAYAFFRKAFVAGKSNYEVRFITQLRRVTDLKNAGKFEIGCVFAEAAIIVSPGQFFPHLWLDAQLSALSEAVGEYTWGYTIESKPFDVVAHKPEWHRFI